MKIIIEKNSPSVSTEPDLTRLEYHLSDYETADCLLIAFIRIMQCIGYGEKTVHNAIMQIVEDFGLNKEMECHN